MTREIERAGIPVAHVCTMLNVSKSVGGNRIIPSRSVLHPTGDPELSPEEEYALRANLVKKAIQAVGTELSEARIFE
jgi:glycine reductase